MRWSKRFLRSLRRRRILSIGAQCDRRQWGEYELRTEILHPGTRSEGRVGRLYLQGVEVLGDEEGQLVEADGVRFIFKGDARPHLWSRSGWEAELVTLPPS